MAAVARFDWDTSAAVLERLLETYRADPTRYQEPNGPALHERSELLDASILTLATEPARLQAPAPGGVG